MNLRFAWHRLRSTGNGDGHPVAEMAADPFTVIAIPGCTVGLISHRKTIPSRKS
ncbi:hypothetical protein F8B43_3434 [Methylorubrum populi]|jgi:hypothetical protein|uniref:Uncharacterized protein n=1 Tax=Methylorubrum populi TaxID=223967 RepID=A0A833N2L0_9HYPH|nr:hypothetical protein F8B43_3434 [Methylorubrum populi]